MRHEEARSFPMMDCSTFMFTLVLGAAVLLLRPGYIGGPSDGAAATHALSPPGSRALCAGCPTNDSKGTINSTSPCQERGGSTFPLKRHKRSCRGQTDQEHISNLLAQFFQEYAESNPGGTGSSRRRAVSWKFEQLDADGNGVLSRRESRTVDPCVMAICDMNKDRRLAQGEWLFCFVRPAVPLVSPGCRDQTDEEHISNTLATFMQEYSESNPGGTGSLLLRAVSWKFEQLDADGNGVLSRRESRPVNPCVMAICDMNKDRRLAQGEWLFCFVRPAMPGPSPEDLSRHESPAPTTENVPVTTPVGCSRTPLAAGFIPECAPDGTFRPVQCHQATGYCWCVNIRTGRPRKGTTTFNARPDCTALTPGCNGFDVTTILDELRHQIAKKKESHPLEDDDDIFNYLDKNQDKYLELKREWVRWRKLKPRNGGRKLVKCWRALGRKCDTDKDQKISSEEWSECTKTVAKRRNLIKRGPNPFSTILKSD